MFGTDLSIVTIRGFTGGPLIVRRDYGPWRFRNAESASVSPRPPEMPAPDAVP
jgi:hypothetical protein